MRRILHHSINLVQDYIRFPRKMNSAVEIPKKFALNTFPEIILGDKIYNIVFAAAWPTVKTHDERFRRILSCQTGGNSRWNDLFYDMLAEQMLFQISSKA